MTDSAQPHTPLPDLQKDEVIKAFQAAARHLMVRVANDPGFAHLMYCTETYSKIIKAYALSKNVELPPCAEIDPVEKTWATIHDKQVPS